MPSIVQLTVTVGVGVDVGVNVGCSVWVAVGTGVCVTVGVTEGGTVVGDMMLWIVSVGVEVSVGTTFVASISAFPHPAIRSTNKHKKQNCFSQGIMDSPIDDKTAVSAT